MLNLQDRTKAPSGIVEEQVDLMADVEHKLVIGNTKRDFASWEPNLGEVRLRPSLEQSLTPS